ncbi:MAG: hypothetical protein ACI388_06365, partial [Methanobrevibacter sp.]|uniref:hypothetical protein n=1 Tax=Methanobrevibacter sp. TaxID=66852 RepID=UPI003F04CAC6
MKRQKIKSYIAAAMTLSVFATGLGVETWAVNAGEKGESFKKVIEFEDTNKFSDNEGNGVRSDLFSDYSGNGFVYLASGWAEVN